MSTIADIENAFNTLRRNEEQQLEAPPNSIRDLSLPANWDNLSDEEKGFFLINDARMARAGVPYAGVTPIGLPFEMIESHLQQIAVARNEHMVANGYWDHVGPDGSNARDAIANDPVLGGSCTEFINRSENLYLAWGGSRHIEGAIFGWLNEAAPNAGHREALLLQNANVDGNVGYGFENNFSAIESEGFMGIDVRRETCTTYPYGSFCAENPTSPVTLVTFVMADPAPAPACANTASFTPYNGIALPVELVSFTGVARGEDVLLSWETASETNNAGFSVQHRTSGGFEEMGFVEGRGTTSEHQAYSFTASALGPGTHSFRLRQVDHDGAFEYSPTVEVSVQLAEGAFAFTAFPNPFSDAATVRFAVATEQEVEVAVYDVLGRRVATSFAGRVEAHQSQEVTVEGASLPNGVYLVQLTGAGISETRMLALTR